MLKLKKIAVTGGLSSGKSSVCLILKELGAYVVNSDKIVHHLLSTDENLCQKVIDILGIEILGDGKIDRTKVAALVFKDLKKLKALEKIIHPAVYDKIEYEYQKQQHMPHPPPLFVAEIPLLYESGGQKDFDAVIAVITDPEISFTRFFNATGQDRNEFNNRMARQFPVMEKVNKADYIVRNNGSLEDLQITIKKLYPELVLLES